MTNQPPPYPGDQPEGTSSTSGLPSYGSVPPPPGADYPPPPPPGAPGGSQEPFSAPDAIAWGWKAFKANLGPIVLAMIAFLVINIGLGVLGVVLQGGLDAESSSQFNGTSIVVNLVSTIVGWFLAAAFARACLDVVDGRSFDFFGAFTRINLLTVLVVSVLVGIGTVLGLLALIVGAIVVVFLTYFSTYFAVDDDASSPIAAIGDSVKLVTSNIGDALLLALLSIVVIIVGFCALLVGLFVAYPVVALASAYAFRRFRGQPVAAL